MNALLIGHPSLARYLETDWAALSFEAPLTLEYVWLPDGGELPVAELVEKARRAEAVGWWWESPHTDAFVETLEAVPELRAIFSDSSIRRHAFVTETHHRPATIDRVRPYFDKLFVPHRVSLPEAEDPQIGWLPSAFPHLTLAEIEALMVKPRQPTIDLVFPFMPYVIGDRVSRLAHIAERLRARSIDFRCGSYVGQLPESYVYQQNYHNVLASAKVVLNLSIFRDLNHRLFESNLLGATVLSDRQSDHDHLEFDAGNSFFFDRGLSDFDENLDAALAHLPTSSPRLDVRNHHCTIHRLAEFLSALTEIAIGVADYDGDPSVQDEGDGIIAYTVLAEDTEMDPLSVEVLALKSCLFNRIETCIDPKAAFGHLQAIAQMTNEDFNYEILLKDIFFLVAPVLGPAEVARISSSNQLSVLYDMVGKTLGRFATVGRLCEEMRDLILESPDLASFRAAFNRGLRT